jgi:hypothetical protein
MGGGGGVCPDTPGMVQPGRRLPAPDRIFAVLRNAAGMFVLMRFGPLAVSRASTRFRVVTCS